MDMHPNMTVALQEAVTVGRMTPQQSERFAQFLSDPANFPLGPFLTDIIPLLGLIFPQIAPFLTLIAQFFGGGSTPTPTPPSPVPPTNIFQQIIAIFQSILKGGTLPVPIPQPAPIGIVPPTPAV